MDRSRILLIVLVLVGLGGGSYEFVDRYRANTKRKAQLAEQQRRAAAEAEKKAKVEAEKRVAAEREAARTAEAEQAAANARAVVAGNRPEAVPGTPRETDRPVQTEVTIGTPKIPPSAAAIKAAAPPPRPLMEPPPPPDKPVPVIPAAEAWINANRLTSTLMGTPRLAVISKKEYLVGQRVPLPGGLGMNLTQIEDGYVVFGADNYHFKMRLKTVKD